MDFVKAVSSTGESYVDYMWQWNDDSTNCSKTIIRKVIRTMGMDYRHRNIYRRCAVRAKQNGIAGYSTIDRIIELYTG